MLSLIDRPLHLCARLHPAHRKRNHHASGSVQTDSMRILEVERGARDIRLGSVHVFVLNVRIGARRERVSQQIRAVLAGIGGQRLDRLRVGAQSVEIVVQNVLVHDVREAIHSD